MSLFSQEEEREPVSFVSVLGALLVIAGAGILLYYLAMLHQFEDEQFFWRHKKIQLYMPDDKKTYSIVSVCNAGNEDYMTTYGDDQKAGSMDAFLNEIQEKSLYKRSSIELLNTSHYIVLSTCTGNDSSRFLVTAIEDEPTEITAERQ